ncbi:ribosomal-protein-alanine acetyltransferase [Alphaproteobacteria bacterium]|nr:ribosomal-protein-alanine acetyltransferase [Alphaproteobacteria bacterium]
MIRASVAHAALLATMHKIGFKVPWSEKDMVETLSMPGTFAFLLEEKTPCGYLIGRIAADETEILSVMVTPPFRRQGLGRRLLDAAIEESRRKGASMIFLEVDSQNFNAQAVYEKAGFYTVGLRPRYYGDSDAFILRKDIGNPLP